MDGDSSGPSESTSHHLETKPVAKPRDYKDSGGALDSPIHGSAAPAHLSQDTPVITSQVYLASKSNVTHSASEGKVGYTVKHFFFTCSDSFIAILGSLLIL